MLSWLIQREHGGRHLYQDISVAALQQAMNDKVKNIVNGIRHYEYLLKKIAHHHHHHHATTTTTQTFLFFPYFKD